MNWKIFKIKRKKIPLYNFDVAREKYDKLEKRIKEFNDLKEFLIGNYLRAYDMRETPVERLINKEITSLRAEQNELSI